MDKPIDILECTDPEVLDAWGKILNEAYAKEMTNQASRGIPASSHFHPLSATHELSNPLLIAMRELNNKALDNMTLSNQHARPDSI